ncbi:MULTISPECIES: hypothetical protein [unclassified Luteibacter]|uniref:hypothetical protein n=1 Tax=Luteibacter sp. PvP019 TaxID=3156436 RepID=UPI0033932BE4
MLEELRKKLLGCYAVEWGADHRRAGPAAPVEATFRHVLNQLTGIGMLASCDEETITAALLGGFSAAFPLCTAIFSGGQSSESKTDASTTCAWGQYSKSRTGEARDNEADRGADFTLVMATGPDCARVALFQAKRVVAGKPNSAQRRGTVRPEPFARQLDEASVTASVVVPDNTYTIDLDQQRAGRLSQLEVLRRTGQRLRRAESLEEARDPKKLAHFLQQLAVADRGPLFPPRRRAGETDEAFENRRTSTQKSYDNATQAAQRTLALDEKNWATMDSTPPIAGLSFVHYLAYLRSMPAAPTEAEENALPIDGAPDARMPGARFTGTICVALSQLDNFFVRAEAGGDKRLDLAEIECIPFEDVILEAFGPQAHPEGWITLSTSTIRGLLPTLLNFGRVFVGTDKGGDGLLLVREADAHIGVGSDAAGTVANAVLSGMHQPTGGNVPTI